MTAPSPEPWKEALAEALDFVVFPPDWTRKERAAGFLSLISRHHDPSCPTPTRTERDERLASALSECLIGSPHYASVPEGCLCRWCKARRLL